MNITIPTGKKFHVQVKNDKRNNVIYVANFEETETGEPGPVEGTGKVAVGDLLVAINGLSIQGGIEEMEGLVKAAQQGEEVTLRFLRLSTIPADTEMERLQALTDLLDYPKVDMQVQELLIAVISDYCVNKAKRKIVLRLDLDRKALF